MSMIESLAPLQQALNFHLERQGLLTSNLVHVDTPGFKAQDLYRTDEGSFEGSFELALSSSGDGAAAESPAKEWEVRHDPYAPLGPDGNSVSLDRESVKIATNNLRYDAISSMIRTRLEELSYAAKDGKG